jgi:hypothetical protein
MPSRITACLIIHQALLSFYFLALERIKLKSRV